MLFVICEWSHSTGWTFLMSRRQCDLMDVSSNRSRFERKTFHDSRTQENKKLDGLRLEKKASIQSWQFKYPELT